MNKLNIFKNKNVCLLGFGIENRSLLDYLLSKKVNCQITICDSASDLLEAKKTYARFVNISWRLGADYDEGLEQFDLVSRVAGYPLFSSEIKQAQKKNKKIIITNPTKLFFSLCPTKNLIGVTGTKGKGTTSGLIVKILEADKRKVFWGGNIGIPMFSFLDKVKADSYVVLELSSFQLEDLEVSPLISVITNLSPEHLKPADPKNPNYHKSLKRYYDAKLNIIRFQKKNGWAVLNTEMEKEAKLRKMMAGNLGLGRRIYFDKVDLASNLFGEYNKKNVAAAYAVGKILKIDEAVIKNGVKGFKGLPHRIEFVKNVGGVNCYDNSFATTPEATIADLDSFSVPVVLLLGGADKGASFKALAKKVKRKADYTILFKGTGSERIYTELKAVGVPLDKMKEVNSMEEAVDLAFRKVKPKGAILLSPACASFGMFNNYKERGDLFQKAVRAR